MPCRRPAPAWLRIGELLHEHASAQPVRETRREIKDHDYEAEVTERLTPLFPGCPADEAARIAAWTCRKHSGRVGRSAAAKEFDPHALRLAVIAHIRHGHTRYDELLMQLGDRAHSRELVRGEIKQVLDCWEQDAS